MPQQIHWEEGLFLQPHHLQQMQKSLFDLTGKERSLTWSYPYGVIEGHLSIDDLRAFRIQFTRLRAVMPSGLEVNFPENAELPTIDIKQAFASASGGFTVYLAVPLWFDSHANTLNGQGGDARAKLIYRVKEIECKDENTGENPKPVLVRRLNARILLENEDRSNLEVLPLFRVTRSTSEESSMPQLDPDFVAPALILNASPVLREIVRDLASQIEASRKELVVQVARGGFSIETLRGMQFEQILRLRTLNRFAARLPSLVGAGSISPFVFYLELRELYSELTALYPDKDDFDVLPYNHDNPVLCFRELSHKIRAYVRGSVAPSFMKVPFVNDGQFLAATLTDEHLTKPNDYFLGVKTREDPRGVVAFVEDADKFKLMPRSLATRAIWGVRLKEERIVPLELPAANDLHYFRLLRSDSQRVWDLLKLEKQAIIRWTGKEDADYNITLYMTGSGG
jgi:type VI secretion system protein ImpJ